MQQATFAGPCRMRDGIKRQGINALFGDDRAGGFE